MRAVDLGDERRRGTGEHCGWRGVQDGLRGRVDDGLMGGGG